MADYTFIKSDENIKLDYYIKEFLSPKYVFYPIKENYKLRVCDNSYVYKNDIIMLNEKRLNIHSSISGKVLGVKDMKYADNNTYPSLVIENDFKENLRTRKSSKKHIDDYTLKEFCEIIKENPIYENNEYLLDKFRYKKDILVINVIELESLFGNKFFTLKDNYEKILETIDFLINLFKFKKCIIAIKNSETDLINEILNYSGTYPNIDIRFVNNIYPIGNEVILNKYLGVDPINLDIKTIYKIYYVLKKRMSNLNKFITITGNAITNRKTIKVKIGSLLSEVFINTTDFKEELVDVYLNGILAGKKIDTLNLVIDDNLEGVIINKKEDKPKCTNCINCGLCFKKCPLSLNPKYVLDKKGNVLKDYKAKCIKCGLCNYICPSHIDLMKYMKGDNDE